MVAAPQSSAKEAFGAAETSDARGDDDHRGGHRGLLERHVGSGVESDAFVEFICHADKFGGARLAPCNLLVGAGRAARRVDLP